MPKVPSAWLGAFALLSPATALAGDAVPALDLTAHPVGLAALLVFILA